MPSPFRYRQLGYAALTVTQLERSIVFYRDLMGLDLVERSADTAYLRCGSDHHNLVLHEGPVPGLRRVGFELESARDLAAAYRHFESLGLAPAYVERGERLALKQGESFRVREPHCGLEFEFYGATTVLARPYVPTVAKIARIGHVVIGTSDFAGTCEALTRDFGFAVSDLVEDRFTFLRCYPNPFHHSFAVGASSSNHLHHVNFMVSDIDDVGRAFHRMRAHDVKIAFGMGRHPPSGSVFLYFYDPDGMTMEYSFGMEEFPELGAREPRLLEPSPESLDTWGATPDPQFGKCGSIEGP
ncbi:MAG TPA: VOC family protein [Methylibium sp.]|nr:VOC family protein [Methylibium sp.]